MSSKFKPLRGFIIKTVSILLNRFQIKFMNDDSIENKTMEQKSSKSSRIIRIICWIIGFMVAFAIAKYLVYGVFSAINHNTQNSTNSISELVKEIKTKITLPSQIDGATTLVDITAEPNAIRYHYILSGVDLSNFTNDYLKNYLISGICQNKDTKNLLNQRLNMEYSYIVKDKTQTFFVSFTKEDCSDY